MSRALIKTAVECEIKFIWHEGKKWENENQTIDLRKMRSRMWNSHWNWSSPYIQTHSHDTEHTFDCFKSTKIRLCTPALFSLTDAMVAVISFPSVDLSLGLKFPPKNAWQSKHLFGRARLLYCLLHLGQIVCPDFCLCSDPNSWNGSISEIKLISFLFQFSLNKWTKYDNSFIIRIVLLTQYSTYHYNIMFMMLLLDLVDVLMVDKHVHSDKHIPVFEDLLIL